MQTPSILFEDADILVLNKPSGITVNRADTTKGEQTMQDWVEENFQFNRHSGEKTTSTTPESKGVDSGQARMTERIYDPVEEFYSRGGIMHRLDKETSGILLAAKNPESFAALKQQFMQRLVKKTYVALAHGNIQPTEGTISVPVGRLEFNRKRFGVVAGGRESVTDYIVLATYMLIDKKIKEPVSLVQLYPQTGRTHQIRVHLKHINHPIFADLLYAGRKTSRDDRKYLNRLFLHAKGITFFHPKTKEKLTFESPLPEDLQSFLNNL